MTTMRPRGPMLHPRVMILSRPCGTVQLGWDPDTALLVDAPGLTAAQVMAFLRLLDGLHTRPQVLWLAGEHGVRTPQTEGLLAALDTAGLLVHPEAPVGRVRSVLVHGLGPLSDAVAAGLRGLGVRPGRSRGNRHEPLPAGRRCDLVVLCDTLVPDPRLVDQLVRGRIAHLMVRVRDGTGVVGPLVLPGLTSCLRCADLARRDRDTAWPRLAAQLLDRVGHATAAGIAATAALALTELEAVVACSRLRAPATLDTTLELDLGSHRLRRRHWRPHPGCGCLSAGAPAMVVGPGTPPAQGPQIS
ncbi:hypothetical protein [Nocardia donostiensis]|nr:hypothetical protein [Nocardia donostiensis]